MLFFFQKIRIYRLFKNLNSLNYRLCNNLFRLTWENAASLLPGFTVFQDENNLIWLADINCTIIFSFALIIVTYVASHYPENQVPIPTYSNIYYTIIRTVQCVNILY